MHEDCAKKNLEKTGEKCSICWKPLGTEPVIELSGAGGGKARYHQKCFVCDKCKKPFSGDSPYHIRKNNKFYHPECVIEDKEIANAPKKNRVCVACGKDITGAVRAVPDMGQFHPECFTCGNCKCELEGSFWINPKTEKPSCKACIDKFKGKWNTMDGGKK